MDPRRYSLLALVSLLLCVFAGAASALTPNDIHSRIDAIQQKIDAGIASGSISNESARVLNFRLSEVRKRLAPGLPLAALNDLSARLDALEPMVPRAMRPQSSEALIEGQLASLEGVIGEGVATHAIIPIAARSLRTELASVRSEFDSARQRGPLSVSETRRLESRIERMVSEIKKYGEPRKQYR